MQGIKVIRSNNMSPNSIRVKNKDGQTKIFEIPASRKDKDHFVFEFNNFITPIRVVTT